MERLADEFRRTRIVATLGPATDKAGVLQDMLLAGIDVARFNCSHGTHEEHAARIEALRKAAIETDCLCAVLLDMQGPEVRTGSLAGGQPVPLATGSSVILTSRNVTGTRAGIYQSYAGLPRELSIGDRVLLDDGLIELLVEDIGAFDITCRVVNGGILGEHKSINVPSASLKLPSLTEKDESDLLFGIENDVDFVAASFVRNADDVMAVREFLARHGGEGISVISKIECAEAVNAFEEILAASDGIMVARGDLGVEVPLSVVPHLQKKFIRMANRESKPVITATQMLESMAHFPRPTRAETTDVANAVYDGTDAVMLSGETANGSYPVASVEMMCEIVRESEKHMFDEHKPDRARNCARVAMAVGKAAVETAENVDAACIIAPTMSGRTARLVSNLRPRVPIYAVTPSEKVARQQLLNWGVRPVVGDMQGGMRDVIANAERAVIDRGLAFEGDVAVLTAGDPSTSPFLGLATSGGDIKEVAATNAMYVVQLRYPDITGE